MMLAWKASTIAYTNTCKKLHTIANMETVANIFTFVGLFVQ